MIHQLRFVIIIFLYALLFITTIFAEYTMDPVKVSASAESIQRFLHYDTPLNPDNVLNAEEGYNGSCRYTLALDLSGESASFFLADYGSFRADDNPDGYNCLAELFTSLRKGSLFLDLGKKRINASPSYFISPINFVLDDYRGYELRFSEGRIMINLEYFSSIGFIGLSFLPEVDVPSRIERYLCSSQSRQCFARYEISCDAGTFGFAASFDDRWRLGGTYSRTIGQYTEFHTECVWGEKDKMQDVIGVIVHLSKASIIAEYYYNQSGYSFSEWEDKIDEYKSAYDVYQKMISYRDLVRNQGRNGRHYLMFRLSNPTTDNWEASITTLMNLQDLGAFVVPKIAYSGWENVTVSMNVAFPVGPTWTEFALYGQAWTAELSMELWL